MTLFSLRLCLCTSFVNRKEPAEKNTFVLSHGFLFHWLERYLFAYGVSDSEIGLLAHLGHLLFTLYIRTHVLSFQGPMYSLLAMQF